MKDLDEEKLKGDAMACADSWLGQADEEWGEEGNPVNDKKKLQLGNKFEFITEKDDESTTVRRWRVVDPGKIYGDTQYFLKARHKCNPTFCSYRGLGN